MARQLWRLTGRFVKLFSLVLAVVVIPTFLLYFLFGLATIGNPGIGPFGFVLWIPTALAVTLLVYYFYRGFQAASRQ
jgi:hypothetical protein